LIALNLLPSMAKSACENSFSSWQSVTTEVVYGLEDWRQTPRKPRQFNIALAFTFQAATRLNPVQVVVDIDIQQPAG